MGAVKPPVADVDPVLLMASASAARFRTVSVRAGMLAPWTRETSLEFLKTMNVGMLLSISKVIWKLWVVLQMVEGGEE